MAPQDHHISNKAIGPRTNADNQRPPAAQGPDESSLGGQHDKPIVIDDDDEEEENGPTNNDSDEDEDDYPPSRPDPEDFYYAVIREWTVEMHDVKPTQAELEAYAVYLRRYVIRQIEAMLNGRRRLHQLHMVRFTIDFIHARFGENADDRIEWDLAYALRRFLHGAAVRELEDRLESLSLVMRDLPKAPMESLVMSWQNLFRIVIGYKNSIGGGN